MCVLRMINPGSAQALHALEEWAKHAGVSVKSPHRSHQRDPHDVEGGS